MAVQPKSKREKVVHLTRADPKGYAGKEKLIGEVRPHVVAQCAPVRAVAVCWWVRGCSAGGLTRLCSARCKRRWRRTGRSLCSR